MPRLFALSALFVSTLAMPAFAAPAPAAPLLPRSFAGWTQTAESASPSNPADAAVLHEYGLAQTAVATYASGANRLTVHAWRFADATGAYGAFTFYRQPQMHAENIGRGSAAAGDHFLMWTGATVMEADFTHSPADEKSQIAALAAQIPHPSGSEAVPPSLPQYLPVAELNSGTVRYAIGPLAYTRMGGVLPPSALDFGQDAEAITAQYGPASAPATLTLVMYPTPQIAAAHLRTIDALAKTSSFTTKRTGPLVAVVSGANSSARAAQLLSQIRFDDYVTINHPEGYVSEGAKLYRLLMGITILASVLMGAALLLGLFLGGGRAVVRMLRGKPVSTVSEEEFISLHLGG